MDQDATWYGGRPRPRRYCARTQLPPRKGAQQALTFGPTLLWHGRTSQQLLSSCLRSSLSFISASQRFCSNISVRFLSLHSANYFLAFKQQSLLFKLGTHKVLPSTELVPSVGHQSSPCLHQGLTIHSLIIPARHKFCCSRNVDGFFILSGCS